MDLRTQAGFLGTNASMLADLTLLAYILILLPMMLVGFIYARRKRFDPQHKYVMTAITIFNWLLILFVMASSFSGGVAPGIPDNLSDTAILFPTIHLVTGGLAQIIATYLLMRMWLEGSLPGWLKVRNIKIWMRLTLSLWVITALLGIIIYVTWYTPGTTAADDTPAPISTEEATDDDAPAPVTTEEATDDAPPPAVTDDAPVATEDDIPDPAATEDNT